MAQPVSMEVICPLKTADIVDRVLVFMEEFTQLRLYTYQLLFCKRAIESILNGEGAEITALWARQIGKSEAVADLCVTLAVIIPVLAKEFPDDPRLKPFGRGFWIGIYAPIEDQADITYSRMRERVETPQAKAVLEELGVVCTKNTNNILAFDNGSRIMASTASPMSKIEGDTHHLVVLEEAQDILRSKVDKSIQPMLAATNGTMIKIGTANLSRGGFHSSIQQNMEEHKRGGKRNHFQFTYEVAIEEKRRMYAKDKNPFHLNYEKHIDKVIRKLGGTNNDEFKMNYMCLWMESRVIAIRPEVFKRACLTNLEMRPPRGPMVVAGLDCAKVRDSTVLTMMEIDMANPIINKDWLPGADDDRQMYYRKCVMDVMELGGAFEGSAGQYRALVEYLRLTSCQILVIDSTGLGGDVIFERIEAMVGGQIQCVPFSFNRVTKSNLYKYYLQEINASRLLYASGPKTQERPEWQKMKAEHLDLDKIESGGLATCEAPEGGHDDYPDSAALACWAEKIMEELFMPEIQVSSPDGEEARSSRQGGRDSRYSRRW